MISKFRILAILEGISYLALGLTMPLKYAYEMPMPNKVVGMAHGVLFISYVIFAMYLIYEKKWKVGFSVIVFIASLLPFGTFILDHYWLKKMSEKVVD